jgi:hypothetical protein
VSRHRWGDFSATTWAGRLSISVKTRSCWETTSPTTLYASTISKRTK